MASSQKGSFTPTDFYWLQTSHRNQPRFKGMGHIDPYLHGKCVEEFADMFLNYQTTTLSKIIPTLN